MTGVAGGRITLGTRVLYTLSSYDAGIVNCRREDSSVGSPLGTPWPLGVQGNYVLEGQSYPAIVVAVFEDGYYNLQVFLDGNDVLWATSRQEGEGSGRFVVAA